MAFFRNLLGLVSGAANRQAGLQSGQPSYYSRQAALPVSTDTALQLSAVWACVRLISESVSSLPVYIYRKNLETGERVLLADHPLQKLLNGKVNRWQTRQEFFETLTYQLVLLGNSYAAVQRNTRKEIIALVPLMSEQMQVTLENSGNRLYTYTDGRDVKIYAEDSIWHSKIFGNGIIGLSPLAYARNSIGIGQAAEETVAKIYRNGGKPSGILTIDKVLKPEQRNQIKQNFSELAEGNDDRLFVLEAGMKYEQVSLSPQDIELLSSRRFQIEDICRFFNVPSVMVNDTSAGTTWGSGIQQIVQGFYKLGLRPYLERYEAGMKAALLTPEERLTTDIEFDFNALLRPDQAERLKMYKDGIQGGVITPNEARTQEGWMKKEGGDSLMVQQQMVKLENIDTVNRGASGQNNF